jgi:heat shock protein beta
MMIHHILPTLSEIHLEDEQCLSLLRLTTTRADETPYDRFFPSLDLLLPLADVSPLPFSVSLSLLQLTAKGLEVVYMVDALDEYLVQSLTEFDGTPLQSITKEGLDLGDKEKLTKQKEELKPLTDWLASVYGDRVKEVTVSNRIAKSPCVLVSGQYGWSANMERIMKAQTFANADEATWLHSKKTMEINPRHPIIKELAAKTAAASGEEEKPQTLVDLANLLYDSALLSSGFQMRDTADFSKRIQRVISNGLQIDPNAEAEAEVEEEESSEESSEAASSEGEAEATPSSDSTPETSSHDEL